MTAEEKKWIDDATIAQLLSKWRFAPIGDGYFCDDVDRTEYFKKVMKEKREADLEAYTHASKSLSW